MKYTCSTTTVTYSIHQFLNVSPLPLLFKEQRQPTTQSIFNLQNSSQSPLCQPIMAAPNQSPIPKPVPATKIATKTQNQSSLQPVLPNRAQSSSSCAPSFMPRRSSIPAPNPPLPWIPNQPIQSHKTEIQSSHAVMPSPSNLQSGKRTRAKRRWEDEKNEPKNKENEKSCPCIKLSPSLLLPPPFPNYPSRRSCCNNKT